MVDMTKNTKSFEHLSKKEIKELCYQVMQKGKVAQTYHCVGWVDRYVKTSPFVNGNIYRIKPEEKNKPSIDWDHVSEEYKFLAIDEDGEVWLFAEKPSICMSSFVSLGGEISKADALASLDRGNCSWEDSLIERPIDE